MKNKMICVLALLIAGAVSAPPVACGQDGLQLLPADTQGILTIKSIEKLYKTFGIEELRSEYPAEFLELKEEMIEELGVDLLDLEALRRFGLDPGKPIYLGFVVQPALATAVLIPSTGDAPAFIQALLEQEDVNFTKRGNAHGVEIYGDEEDEVAYFAKDSYVVVVLTDEDDGGLPAMESAKNLLAATQKGTLANSKKYKKALEKIPGEADLTFYMGPEFYDKMLDMEEYEELEEEGVSPEELRELYDKWGLSGASTVVKARLESTQLVTESFTWMDKDSEVLEWYQPSNDPTDFLGRVPSDPMLAMVGRINFAKVWASLEVFDDVIESDSIPDFEDTLDEASDNLGVDIVEDLIKQFDGNVVFLISQIQMMNNDAVILLQLSRPEEFRTTLSALVEEIDASIEVNPSEESGQANPELLREEYNGVSYFTFLVPPMVQVSFGVVEDHLVVASSRQRFNSIVKGGRSFVDEIGNEEVKQVLANRTGNAFYMDFQKIAANLQAWAPMLGEESFEIIEVLNEMKELVGVSRLEDDGFWQRLTVTGARPEMWKRLLAAGIENVPEDLDVELGDDPEDTTDDEG